MQAGLTRTCFPLCHLQKMVNMSRLGKISHSQVSHSNMLVWGGSGVLGRAIARKFAEHGWSVGIHYHNNRLSAEKTRATIQQGDKNVRLYQANVHEPSQITQLFQEFLQDYGTLHLLIWAVGIAPSKLLTKTTPEIWQNTLQTNLTGAFHVLKTAGLIFERQRHGTVILVGSLSGEQGMPGQAAYAASKAGLMGLMQTTAQEWGNWNIQVNAIFPGWHSSPLSEPRIDSAIQRQPHLLHRTPSLDQMTASVYHLASTQDVSGQIWNLDSRIW